MNAAAKWNQHRTEEFQAALAQLLAKIKTAAEDQFLYNEKENLPRGIVKPEYSYEHAIKNGVVAAMSSRNRYCCEKAVELAIHILEDSNCHGEAKALSEVSSETTIA